MNADDDPRFLPIFLRLKAARDKLVAANDELQRVLADHRAAMAEHDAANDQAQAFIRDYDPR